MRLCVEASGFSSPPPKHRPVVFPREMAEWQVIRQILNYGLTRTGLKNGKIMNRATKKIFWGNKLLRRWGRLYIWLGDRAGDEAGRGASDCVYGVCFPFLLSAYDICRRMKRKPSLFNKVIRRICCLSIPAQRLWSSGPWAGRTLESIQGPRNDSLSLTINQQPGP